MVGVCGGLLLARQPVGPATDGWLPIPANGRPVAASFHASVARRKGDKLLRSWHDAIVTGCLRRERDYVADPHLFEPGLPGVSGNPLSVAAQAAWPRRRVAHATPGILPVGPLPNRIISKLLFFLTLSCRVKACPPRARFGVERSLAP